jgi:hypothetical protein
MILVMPCMAYFRHAMVTLLDGLVHLRPPKSQTSARTSTLHCHSTSNYPAVLQITPGFHIPSAPASRPNKWNTCLNLNSAADDSTESDLWILPDFDDWELDGETPRKEVSQGELAPLLRRAASSNRERLRARLEGDGWDFVGGKYGEDEKILQEAASQSEESVDEEFDVVVLPIV